MADRRIEVCGGAGMMIHRQLDCLPKIDDLVPRVAMALEALLVPIPLPTPPPEGPFISPSNTVHPHPTMAVDAFYSDLSTLSPSSESQNRYIAQRFTSKSVPEISIESYLYR